MGLVAPLSASGSWGSLHPTTRALLSLLTITPPSPLPQERGNTNAKFWSSSVLAALGGERHWHQVGLRQLRCGLGWAQSAAWLTVAVISGVLKLAWPPIVSLLPPPPGCPRNTTLSLTFEYPSLCSGMLILVFARNHLRDHIGEVTTASVACGVLGVGGNKGAVAVEFSVHRRKIAVVCSHFAAHQVGVSWVGNAEPAGRVGVSV